MQFASGIFHAVHEEASFLSIKHDVIQSQLIQYGFAPEWYEFFQYVLAFVQLLTGSIAASRLNLEVTSIGARNVERL